MWLYHRVMSPNNADGIANSVDPDQTAPDRVKRIWYLSPMRAAKVQASLRIRSVSPEPSLLAHTSSESRGTFRQKTRSLAPLNGWACAVKICHYGCSKTQIRLTGLSLIWVCTVCPGLSVRKLRIITVIIQLDMCINIFMLCPLFLLYRHVNWL